MGKNVWLIEKLDPDEGAATDWQQWNLGISEEGFFRTEASFFSEEMALKFKAAIEWFECLENDFTIKAAPVPAIKPRTKARTRSNKP